MKNICSFSLTLLAFACVSLTGCNSDNNAGNAKGRDVTLYAGCDADATSRTVLDASGNQLWSLTDVINVNGTTSTKTSLPGGNTYAAFTVAATAPYYAFYPGTASNLSYDSSTHLYTFTFPSTQAYNESGNSFSDGVNPMVAVTSTTTTYLPFYNVCGVLKAQLSVNIAGISAVRFVSVDNAVAGAATVNPTRKTMQVTGTTMNMDVTFTAAKTLTSSSPMTIYWVLPTGTYGTGWQIQLLDSSGNVSLQSTSVNPIAISRSCITSAGTLIWANPSSSTPLINDAGTTTVGSSL
jgi:hypothetical protein